MVITWSNLLLVILAKKVENSPKQPVSYDNLILRRFLLTDDGVVTNQDTLQKDRLKMDKQEDTEKEVKTTNILAKDSYNAGEKGIFKSKIIPVLKSRCSKYPIWTPMQVDRCLAFAEDGVEYDPSIFDDGEDVSFNQTLQEQLLRIAGHWISFSIMYKLVGFILVAVLVSNHLSSIKSRIRRTVIYKSS
jgi:hypothetical protein